MDRIQYMYEKRKGERKETKSFMNERTNTKPNELIIIFFSKIIKDDDKDVNIV